MRLPSCLTGLLAHCTPGPPAQPAPACPYSHTWHTHAKERHVVPSDESLRRLGPLTSRSVCVCYTLTSPSRVKLIPLLLYHFKMPFPDVAALPRPTPPNGIHVWEPHYSSLTHCAVCCRQSCAWCPARADTEEAVTFPPSAPSQGYLQSQQATEGFYTTGLM